MWLKPFALEKATHALKFASLVTHIDGREPSSGVHLFVGTTRVCWQTIPIPTLLSSYLKRYILRLSKKLRNSRVAMGGAKLGMGFLTLLGQCFVFIWKCCSVLGCKMLQATVLFFARP